MVLRYSAAVNCYTSINLTKLDVLDTFPLIRVAVAYCTSNGEKLTSFPADLSLLDNCTVEYVDLGEGSPVYSFLIGSPLKLQMYLRSICSTNFISRLKFNHERLMLTWRNWIEGWQSPTKGLQTWSRLPLQAQRYIEFIEASVGTKIGYIGTGPDREDMIIRE